MVMKTSEAEILLQKYYDGLTSPEEEAAISSFLLDDAVPAGFEADRLHFEAIASMRDEDIPVPEDLESSVLAELSRVQNPVRRIGRRSVYMVASVAAGLLLMVSSVLFLSRNTESTTVSDPQLAYAETRQALETVSRYLNEGTSRLSGLSRMSSAIGPLSHLKSLDKASQNLSRLGRENTNK